MKLLKTLLLSALVVSPLAAAKSDIHIHDAYARAMAPGAKTSAVFMTLMNHSDATRTVVSATTPAAGKVELHDVIKEGEVMKMRQVSDIQIPAHGTTELKPGSLHVMLFDLKRQLADGEHIMVTVTFKNGETQTFKAPVKKVMAGMKKHDHGHHHH